MSATGDPTPEYTVGELASLTGVSVRTLHHYDEIGLVRPSRRSAAGYRIYSDIDVARLYRVLTYRELGFRLEQIATLLDDPDCDTRAHLARQRELLTERIERLHRMVAAVEDVMNAERTGINLTAAEQAEIFGDDWLGEEYAAEAEQRWGGTDAWAQSRQRTRALTKADWQQVRTEIDTLEADLARAMTDGIEPGSAEADALAERHRESINRFYDCDHAMQVSLAQMYLADARFTAHYDDRAPGLARYLHDVIVANADGVG